MFAVGGNGASFAQLEGSTRSTAAAEKVEGASTEHGRRRPKCTSQPSDHIRRCRWLKIQDGPIAII